MPICLTFCYRVLGLPRPPRCPNPSRNRRKLSPYTSSRILVLQFFKFWRFSRNIDKFSNFAPKTRCLTVSTTCCVLRKILGKFLKNKDQRAFFELQLDTKMAKVEREMKMLQTKVVELYLAFCGKAQVL